MKHGECVVVMNGDDGDSLYTAPHADGSSECEIDASTNATISTAASSISSSSYTATHVDLSSAPAAEDSVKSSVSSKNEVQHEKPSMRHSMIDATTPSQSIASHSIAPSNNEQKHETANSQLKLKDATTAAASQTAAAAPLPSTNDHANSDDQASVLQASASTRTARESMRDASSSPQHDDSDDDSDENRSVQSASSDSDSYTSLSSQSENEDSDVKPTASSTASTTSADEICAAVSRAVVAFGASMFGISPGPEFEQGIGSTHSATHTNATVAWYDACLNENANSTPANSSSSLATPMATYSESSSQPSASATTANTAYPSVPSKNEAKHDTAKSNSILTSTAIAAASSHTASAPTLSQFVHSPTTDTARRCNTALIRVHMLARVHSCALRCVHCVVLAESVLVKVEHLPHIQKWFRSSDIDVVTTQLALCRTCVNRWTVPFHTSAVRT